MNALKHIPADLTVLGSDVVKQILQLAMYLNFIMQLGYCSEQGSRSQISSR